LRILNSKRRKKLYVSDLSLDRLSSKQNLIIKFLGTYSFVNGSLSKLRWKKLDSDNGVRREFLLPSSFRSRTDVSWISPTTEQHLIAERDRLNKDLEQAHSYVLLSLSLSLSYPEFLLGFRSTYSQIHQIPRIRTRSNWWSNRIRFDRFP